MRIPADIIVLVAPIVIHALLPGGGPTSGRWRGQALGVCWEGSPQPMEEREVEPLVALGVNAISQTPFAWMRDPRRPELSWSSERGSEERGWWGERAQGVRFLARAARERGIATLLKPHVWLHGSWPGDIEMSSEEDWRAWFASYREFLLEWARFAAAEELEGLCIGTELDRTLVREAEWRALIRDVKQVYGGLLTYAANWTHFEQVPFWEELDAIGVNAYFPLSTSPRPSVAELEQAWQPLRARLAGLAERHERPIVFTEIGYRPVPGVFERPWDYETRAEPDPECQSNGYQAALRVFLDEPWFGGLFWWKWHASASLERRRQRSSNTGFSPQGQPAEEIVRRAYRELGDS